MEDKIICGCYKVSKSTIVEAIKNGADTVEKVGEVTKAGTGCGRCKSTIEQIIREVKGDEKDLVCGCYNVTKEEIVDAVRSGADTVEKVGARTKAGTGCGKCRRNIETIIGEVVDEQVICGCYKVNKKQIVDAIRNGADTVEKVGEATKAGTGCGACKGTIEDIIKEINGEVKEENEDIEVVAITEGVIELDDENEVEVEVREEVGTEKEVNDRLVCGCYKVTKEEIIDAVRSGADTVEKVGARTKAGTGCGKCRGNIEKIIEEVKDAEIICGCYQVSKEEIVDAINNGAVTVEEVGKATKAGTGCGLCKGTIQNIIDEEVNNRVVCGCYNVTQSTIENAIDNGATTVEAIGEVTKAGTGCGGCKDEIQKIIDKKSKDEIICSCYNVSKSRIVEAVKNGANTVKKVGVATKAGTGCGGCKGKIQEIIYEVNGDRVLCACKKVRERDVVKAIENGATTVNEVAIQTKAGTGCTRCKPRIEELINDVHGVQEEEKGFFSKLTNMFKGN